MVAKRGSEEQLRKEVYERVQMFEPVTLEFLASYREEDFGATEQAVAELERQRLLKRWTDSSQGGLGRTFIGSVGKMGLPEPDAGLGIGQSSLRFDVRSILASARSTMWVTLKRLAKNAGITADEGRQVVEHLERLGHVVTSKRGRTEDVKSAECVARKSWRYTC